MCKANKLKCYKNLILYNIYNTNILSNILALFYSIK